MSKQLNFAQQMDEVLKTLGPQRPKLLLHACCGPCSSAVLEKLCRYFEITVLYYNPNTWPAEEYYRRGEELKKFVAQAHPLGVTVIEDHYDPQEFYTAVQGLENEPERGGRCPRRVAVSSTLVMLVRAFSWRSRRDLNPRAVV